MSDSLEKKERLKPIFEGHRTVPALKIREQIIAGAKPQQHNTND